MTIQQQIEQCLNEAFQPDYLEVVNESGMHNVPPGSESHFKVTIVSRAFDGDKLIARHRKMNQAIGDIMASIHAFSMHTYTPEEWHARNASAPESPQCMGGGK